MSVVESDASKKLAEAFKMQFQWVSVLFQQPEAHTATERRTALLFLGMHVTFLLCFLGHRLTIVISWMLLFVLQALALGAATLQLAKIEEYASSMKNAMELERVVNPAVVAAFALRVFSIGHAALSRSWVVAAAGLVEIVYDVCTNRNFFMVDATTVWKHVAALRRDARVRLGYQVVMVIVCMANLLIQLLRS